jgi:N-terminal 7TM region of histidine kinase
MAAGSIDSTAPTRATTTEPVGAGRNASSPRWRTVALAACGFFLLLPVASNVMEARSAYIVPQSAGDIGARFSRTTGSGPQHVVVRDIAPRSPLNAASFREGDHVRLDHPWDDLRTLRAGEEVGLTSLTPGRPQQHAIVAVPPSAPSALAERFATHTNLLANASILLVGLFVLWRSRSELGVIALGLAFALNGTASPYRWPQSAQEYPFWHVAINFGFTLVPWLLLFFTMDYVSRNTRMLRSWEWRAYAGLLGLQIAIFGAAVYSVLLNTTLSSVISAELLNVLMQVLCVIVSFSYLFRGLRSSSSDQRRRYALLIAALALVFLPVIPFVVMTWTSGYRYNSLSPVMLTSWTCQVLGALLFVYVIFRHKMLDLGFAINRTLIYGIISTGLLVTFGLIEWGSERLLPHESLEASAIVNAAVALTLFLAFHRLRNAVENGVNRVLFRDWHDNEARLRKFAREAAFIGKPGALAASTVAALRRFAGGAEVGLNMREGGEYACTQGGLARVPSRIDGDDPAAVAMRHDREALEPAGANSGLPAALALPMTHGAELDGFILLGPKPSGDGYRPDEVEILSATTQQIGLDLHALKVAALEQRIVSLEERNDELRDLLARGAAPAE